MQIKTNLKCKNFWGNNEWGQGQYQVVQDLINPPALISRLPSLTLPNRLCKNPRESLFQRKIKQISKSLTFEPSSILQFNQITSSFQCRNVNDKTAVVLLPVSFKCFKQNYSSFPPFH